MYIQLDATGNPALDLVDTTKLHPEFVPKGTAPAFPVLSTQFGGKLTSGSFKFFNKTSKPVILWKTPSGTTIKRWEMASDAALQTAKTTIATETASFVLLPDGTKDV